MDYPVLDIIKQKAEAFNGGEGKPITTLANEIKKTSAWVYGIKSIDNLTMDMVQRLSKSLEFDLLGDYNEWRLSHNQPSLFMTADPETEYKKLPAQMKITSATLTLRGEQQLSRNFEEVIKSIKKECEHYGIELDNEVSLRGSL